MQFVTSRPTKTLFACVCNASETERIALHGDRVLVVSWSRYVVKYINKTMYCKCTACINEFSTKTLIFNLNSLQQTALYPVLLVLYPAILVQYLLNCVWTAHNPFNGPFHKSCVMNRQCTLLNEEKKQLASEMSIFAVHKNANALSIFLCHLCIAFIRCASLYICRSKSICSLHLNPVSGWNQRMQFVLICVCTRHSLLACHVFVRLRVIASTKLSSSSVEVFLRALSYD